MIIEFFWNGSFVGETYSFSVDGKLIELNLGPSQDRDEAMDKIVELLKNDYCIDYKKEDINFKWGGQL